MIMLLKRGMVWSRLKHHIQRWSKTVCGHKHCDRAADLLQSIQKKQQSIFTSELKFVGVFHNSDDGGKCIMCKLKKKIDLKLYSGEGFFLLD